MVRPGTHQVNYSAIIHHSVLGGLPCQIGVHTYRVVRGSFAYNAPSDLDYNGYTDIEYDILDRRGRPAAWIERRLTRQDYLDIEQLIADYYQGDDHD